MTTPDDSSALLPDWTEEQDAFLLFVVHHVTIARHSQEGEVNINTWEIIEPFIHTFGSTQTPPSIEARLWKLAEEPDSTKDARIARAKEENYPWITDGSVQECIDLFDAGKYESL